MTIDQFVEKLKTLDVKLYQDCIDNDPEYRFIDYQDYDEYNENSVLMEKWVTGGMSGGSCWDDDDDHLYELIPDKEPKFSGLDTILLHLSNCDRHSIKEILSIAKTGSYCEPEHYGNYTYYDFKYIIISDLYNKLHEMNLLED